MSKVYRISRSASRFIYKIKHHRGHGIHSPFVFDLITKVIEEKTPYYAYDDINHYLNQINGFKFKITKTHLLLFKLVNWFSAKNILVIGSGNGVGTLFLTASSSQISCISVEVCSDNFDLASQVYDGWRNKILLNDHLPEEVPMQDCIYVNLNNHILSELDAARLFSMVNEKSFIVVDGIRSNSSNRKMWRKQVLNKKTVISLDLYDLGILFFNQKYFKRNYKLSF